jgi:hypothetical protein
MKFSSHSLIPFLLLFCSSTLLNCSLLYNHFARTTQKTQPLYCWEGVFTAPLHRNWSYSIVACVFVAAGMCLPSCCLAMNIYSDFTIPAFGRHVTIFKYTTDFTVPTILCLWLQFQHVVSFVNKIRYFVRFEVMKSSFFWDITPCIQLRVNRRFGGTCWSIPPKSVLTWSGLHRDTSRNISIFRSIVALLPFDIFPFLFCTFPLI